MSDTAMNVISVAAIETIPLRIPFTTDGYADAYLWGESSPPQTLYSSR